MTSKKLKLHQDTQDAITGLKEGHLSEADFWKAIQKSDMGSFWKKYEWARGKSPEAQEAWQQMGGPGVLAKKTSFATLPENRTKPRGRLARRPRGIHQQERQGLV